MCITQWQTPHPLSDCVKRSVFDCVNAKENDYEILTRDLASEFDKTDAQTFSQSSRIFFRSGILLFSMSIDANNSSLHVPLGTKFAANSSIPLYFKHSLPDIKNFPTFGGAAGGCGCVEG